MLLSYLRTVILYLVLIAVIRLMGKRQIGQMEPAEFVVTMLVANLAAIPMQDNGIPLLSGLVPILTVLGMELVLSSAAMCSIWVRRMLCGKPVILIENGKILQHALRATRVTLDELTGKVREKDILDISCVQYAILETDGNLSVFPWPQGKPLTLPISIIEDGHLFEENLRLAGRDKKWVQKILDKHHTSLRGTWLLTVDDAGNTLWLPKEEKK